jgi:HK97 family phage prohead protease
MNTALRRDSLVGDREERFATGIELRAGSDGQLRFEGVASTVEDPYDVFGGPDAGGFVETMATGAFNQTITRGDIRLLVNHDGVPIARTKSRNMSVAADPHLRVSAQLDPQNPTVTELRSAMSRGDIDQMSIAFKVVRDAWTFEDGTAANWMTGTHRRIDEVKLYEASIVTLPANPNTSASLRSLLTTDLDGPELVRAAMSRLAEMLPPDEPAPEFDEETHKRMLRDWEHRTRDPFAA